MAITELIFPKIKNDQASIDEIERDWPEISRRLTHPNPGVLCAYRGWVLTENGRNVGEEHREFLLFEWNRVESFHAFVVSEQFVNFAASIRHLVNGPPTLQVFETNFGPGDAASASSVEIYRVSVPNAENAEAALKTWEEISRKAQETYGDKVAITYGKSQNLEEEVIAGIIGWSRPEDCVPATGGAVLADSFESLKTLGGLSHITVGIDTMELPTL
ncbi:uncharacterized protein N7473_005826 [Penicillium subrubescens]|uniref:ABM domain-containing protein n=1 Tax=Penicillium subrubescens TaxID=1316194 RepID=A0A1Q5UGR1_9EURO|nr:uncharacterized protein N7473_005826 [Penicillium subrubescens]KAJ5896427.1 hypothetical protein N7473_005826 [Penicillium subrubescens]OKP11651.1 hypothetical protein PENSUB_2723 [Penicillium subrubescens]